VATDPRFTHAIDLVSYIRSNAEFSDTFDIGVAGSIIDIYWFETLNRIFLGYPDGHADKETTEDEEIEHLKMKVDAGANFIVTQLFYDVDNFLRWLRKIRQRGM